MQTVHRPLRNFVFRWVALDPIRMKVLYHNCIAMLHTRFALFIGTSMVRRDSLTKYLRQMNTVSSCIRADFVSVHTSQVGSLGKV